MRLVASSAANTPSNQSRPHSTACSRTRTCAATRRPAGTSWAVQSQRPMSSARASRMLRARAFQRLFVKHHSGCPTVSVISPRPSMRPTITSPGTTAPTPAGVPV